MRVLVVGGGGREHALAWGLARSASVDKVFAAPGNAGISDVAACEPIPAAGAAALADFAEAQGVDLVVVGPEVPLVDGLADRLSARGLTVFGPSAKAARIEGSKAWAKTIMTRAGIPTAASATFDALEPALRYLRDHGAPCVVKADGLAAGKGVRVCETLEEAADAVRDCLERRVFGDAGATIVVEEALSGEELSVFCVADGTSVVPLAAAQDHKRLLDGDRGPNTGGMGAYSPVPHLDHLIERVVAETFEPAVAAMAAEGSPFTGVLFGGFMVTSDGPKTLEFNCRFGDPEAQVLITRLESDLGELLHATATGGLSRLETRWSLSASACVVVAGDGYPGRSDSGTPIDGIGAAAETPDAVVFHAGTARRDGRVVTAGGRILGVTATGPDLHAARERCYEAVGKITFQGMRYRTDIGARGLGKEV